MLAYFVRIPAECHNILRIIIIHVANSPCSHSFILQLCCLILGKLTIYLKVLVSGFVKYKTWKSMDIERFLRISMELHGCSRIISPCSLVPIDICANTWTSINKYVSIDNVAEWTDSLPAEWFVFFFGGGTD